MPLKWIYICSYILAIYTCIQIEKYNVGVPWVFFKSYCSSIFFEHPQYFHFTLLDYFFLDWLNGLFLSCNLNVAILQSFLIKKGKAKRQWIFPPWILWQHSICQGLSFVFSLYHFKGADIMTNYAWSNLSNVVDKVVRRYYNLIP